MFLSRIFGKKNAGQGIGNESQRSQDPTNLFGQTTQSSLSASAAVALAPAQPSQTARYRRGDILGSIFEVERVLVGGMGVVYICRQLSYDEVPKSQRVPIDRATKELLDRRFEITGRSTKYYALKSFRRELLFHGDVRRRFDHEVQLWVSLLPHPNIVRAETLLQGWEPLLWLEYVDGGDLSRHLGRPLPPQEVARIALQFRNGMIFLFESASIVHRDIKPANILVTARGTVKITDFGLARAFLGSEEQLSDAQGTGTAKASTAGFATECGRIMGSLPWMSPEQFTAPGDVTVASDIYSFGVVLYEMYTGKMPYSLDGDWLRRVLHEIPPTPAKVAGVDEESSAIVMKCLEKKPADRFANFAELRTAFEQWAIQKGWSSLIPPVMTRVELEAAMTAGDWLNRGFALGQIGKNEESCQSYLKALDLDPTTLGIHMSIGSALIRLGRFDEGMQHHQRQTEITPTMALAWDALANDHLRRNCLPEGLNASRKASELDPENIALVRRHAIIARHAGAANEYQRSLEALKALLSTPRYDKPEHAINEAIQCFQSGDVKTAIDLHCFSVTKYPKEAATWYNFGVTAHRCGQLEQAIEFYSRAIELDTKATLAWANRGVIRVHRNEYGLAKSDWQMAIASDPSHTVSQILQVLVRNNLIPYVKQHPQLNWEKLTQPWVRYLV